MHLLQPGEAWFFLQRFILFVGQFAIGEGGLKYLTKHLKFSFIYISINLRSMVTSKLKVRKASVITLFSITCNFLTRERGYKLYHLYACFHSFVKSQIFCLCSLILSSHWLCLRIILTLCITLLQAFSCKDFKDIPPVGSFFILQVFIFFLYT